MFVSGFVHSDDTINAQIPLEHHHDQPSTRFIKTDEPKTEQEYDQCMSASSDETNEFTQPFAVLIKKYGIVMGGINCHIKDKVLFIDQLWLDQKLQKTGLGTLLMDETEQFAKEFGCTSIRVVSYSYYDHAFYTVKQYESSTFPSAYTGETAYYFEKLIDADKTSDGAEPDAQSTAKPRI